MKSTRLATANIRFVYCAHEVFFTREIVRKDNNRSTLNRLIVVASGVCMLKSDLTHRFIVGKVHMNILCEYRICGIIQHYQSQVHETTKFFS